MSQPAGLRADDCLLPTTVVVSTLGRPSLQVLLDALAGARGPRPQAIVLVDDRPGRVPPLEPSTQGLGTDVSVVRSGGAGPAAARNVGWRTARTPWVSFLDDDVVPAPDWYECLHLDLRRAESAGGGNDGVDHGVDHGVADGVDHGVDHGVADGVDHGGEVAASQGRVEVPLPSHRRSTDWERGTAGLADAAWITADMSYRRTWLSRVGGFDERFPRAFREDSDLALRVRAAGGWLERGERLIVHPVRPADDRVSLRQQAGNADDALMRRLHGPTWRDAAQAPLGRLPGHLLVSGAAVAAAAAALLGRRRLAAVAAAVAVAGVGEFAAARIRPGPRDLAEVRRMLLTSVAIPFAASWHAARGTWRHRHATSWSGPPELVLFDRDGTLIEDVPYNGDPDLVTPVPGARAVLDRLRAVGVRSGVVTNQSAVGSGRLTADQVDAVNARVEALLGPFDVWQVCPHTADDGCACRKPGPAMVLEACRRLGVDPSRCAVVGDIGSDVEAAAAAGATGVLVPTPRTRRLEVARAGCVRADLRAAVDTLLRGTA